MRWRIDIGELALCFSSRLESGNHGNVANSIGFLGQLGQILVLAALVLPLTASPGWVCEVAFSAGKKHVSHDCRIDMLTREVRTV